MVEVDCKEREDNVAKLRWVVMSGWFIFTVDGINTRFPTQLKLCSGGRCC